MAGRPFVGLVDSSEQLAVGRRLHSHYFHGSKQRNEEHSRDLNSSNLSNSRIHYKLLQMEGRRCSAVLAFASSSWD